MQILGLLDTLCAWGLAGLTPVAACSFGIILWELCTWAIPWGEDSSFQVRLLAHLR